MQVTECQVFQLSTKFAHTQPMRYGSIDIHRLLSDKFSLVSAQVLQRAHVMQPIRKFDEHHAHVINHRQEHLANVFRLLLLTRDIADLGNFGESIHQVSNLFAEILTDCLEVDKGVLHDVMQQTSCHRHFVQIHFGKDVGNLEWVNEVGFTRRSFLPLVFACGEEISAADQIEVGLWVIMTYTLYDFFNSNHPNARPGTAGKVSLMGRKIDYNK